MPPVGVKDLNAWWQHDPDDLHQTLTATADHFAGCLPQADLSGPEWNGHPVGVHEAVFQPEVRTRRLALAVVRDLRVARVPATTEDLEVLETDVLAGFVLARAAAGLSDGTISSDVVHLEQVRTWFGRPLWEMEPPDADVYFGKVLRSMAKGTRLSRAQALKTFFLFLELRHKVEIHQMTGRVVECPIDELNRPRGRQQARLRVPPTAEQVTRLFTGWRQELATCRKFAPAARNYTARRLSSRGTASGRLRWVTGCWWGSSYYAEGVIGGYVPVPRLAGAGAGRWWCGHAA